MRGSDNELCKFIGNDRDAEALLRRLIESELLIESVAEDEVLGIISEAFREEAVNKNAYKDMPGDYRANLTLEHSLRPYLSAKGLRFLDTWDKLTLSFDRKNKLIHLLSVEANRLDRLDPVDRMSEEMHLLLVEANQLARLDPVDRMSEVMHQLSVEMHRLARLDPVDRRSEVVLGYSSFAHELARLNPVDRKSEVMYLLSLEAHRLVGLDPFEIYEMKRVLSHQEKRLARLNPIDRKNELMEVQNRLDELDPVIKTEVMDMLNRFAILDKHKTASKHPSLCPQYKKWWQFWK
jgi:hypothetical protein